MPQPPVVFLVAVTEELRWATADRYLTVARAELANRRRQQSCHPTMLMANCQFALEDFLHQSNLKHVYCVVLVLLILHGATRNILTM